MEKPTASIECDISADGRKVVIKIKSLTKGSLTIGEMAEGLKKVMESLLEQDDPNKPPKRLMN